MELNENTPGEVLQELALKEKSAMLLSLYNDDSCLKEMPAQYEKSKNILRAIAKNANTPPDTLKELFEFECCPIEVLNNISLSLILLENPCFLEELYHNSADNSKVFGMDNVPSFFEEWGVYNKNISIRKSAALRIKSASLLEICLKDENPLVRTYLAINENTPGYILEKLAFDKDKEVRLATARNFNTPKNALSLLSQDKYVDIRISVASNINTPEEIFRLLAKSKSKRVREAVAGNNHVGLKTLELLARDKTLAKKNNYVVHKGIVINSDIFKLLTSDDDT